MLTSLVDVPIDVFGGYCPAIVPSNLPSGAANIAQDVMFPQAGVRTRGGLGTGLVFGGAAIPSNASINGLKTYLNAQGTPELMIWDSLGDMFKENPQGTLDLINSRPYQNLFYESQTLFSREYQAFFNAAGGFDIPRQYDDTNWDRVSQVGPGVGPNVTNALPAKATLQGPAGAGVAISTIIFGDPEVVGDVKHSQFYYTTFEVTTTAPHGLAVGQSIVIAGSTTTPSVNQRWAVATIISPTQFKVNVFFLQSSTVNGGGGTVTPNTAAISRIGGNVTASTSAAHGFQPGWTVNISGFADIAIGGGIVSIGQANGVATAVTTTANGLVVGAAVDITSTTSYNSPPGGWIVTGITNATTFTFGFPNLTAATETSGVVSTPLDGTFTILTVPSTTSFTYTQLGPDEVSTGTGTAIVVGNISAGQHLVSVAFITRQGFITQASPPVQFNANGGTLAGLTQIPTGPPNIAQRLLLFTPAITPPATSGTFYSITSSMVIPDNTTTAALVDFYDSILISSFNAEYLFSELELGESAFMLPYNARTVWLGERSKVPNFVNLTFDGGFSGATPNAWVTDPVNGAGGGSALAQSLSTDWGDAYTILCPALGGAIKGLITQTAFQDFLGVAIIQANIGYSVRVRLAVSPGSVFTQGKVHVNLQSTLGSFQTTGINVNLTSLTTSFQEFTAVLTAPIPIPQVDLQLQVYADGSPSNGTVIIDSIEPYPTLTPINSSIARLSRAFNPESFDSITGQVQIRPGDGQSLRAGFPLRNSLYLAKDHYLGYVTDDGVNEPASWTFTEVSATVGICGPNAVDWMEEWAVFAERSGLYICWGSDPVKITPEIQTDVTHAGRVSWESINWLYGHTIWVRIDRVNKLILIGAPINGATSPNVVFMMDYKWLDSAEDIASAPMVGYSQFTGKILGHGRGRRWAIWNITANSMAFAERADGTVQPFFGGVGDGKIFWQQDVKIQGSDNGVAIASQYQSYAAPSSTEEQQYQLRAHRKLLGYLKFRAVGVGLLNLAISTTQRSTILRPYALSLNPSGDGERPTNVHGERFFLTVSTNAVNQWFQLDKWIPCMKKDSSALVRGVSA